MAHFNSFIYSDVNTLISINGKPELVYDLDAINMSLYNILTTPIGSRRFFPQYGSRAYNFLQEQTTDTVGFQMKLSIVQSITQFEPRVSVSIPTTDVIPLNPATGFLITINYSIKNSGKQSEFILELEKRS